jgi:hypothetical protein
MIIHQNPLFKGTKNSETRRHCAVVMKTIEAISTFAQLFPSAHPSTYFNTAFLVECIQLVPFLRSQTKGEGSKAALRSFREAQILLSDLSILTEGAKHALTALESVNIKDEDGVPFDAVESHAEFCAMIQNHLQPQHQTCDVSCLSLPGAFEFMDHHLPMESSDMWSRFLSDDTHWQAKSPPEMTTGHHNFPV